LTVIQHSPCPKFAPTESPHVPTLLYLRDQADNCRWHADRVSDAETQADLQELAAEYTANAVKIERRNESR
jgi:hypothetical protein